LVRAQADCNASMRWPIQVQLLIPILLVVSLAIVLASAITAYFGSVRDRRQQEDRLRRVVATLMEASFPLTERVLQQMQGLSGAEFVLVDERGQIQASTLPLAAVMEQARGQCAAAARQLGLHRTTLRKKLDQFGITGQ